MPVESIAGKIYLIRGTKVMPDRDLAPLYGVETKSSNGLHRARYCHSVQCVKKRRRR